MLKFSNKMIQITKENNSLKVVGVNNPTYPYSGTLTFPINSVVLVTDSSDMAVFRSVANNDVLFSGMIGSITIGGQSVTKETIITEFGKIANSSSSGGGTGGAVDSVNGQTGTVVLTANDVNAYAKNEVDGLLGAKVSVDVYNRDIPTLATKEELALKADKSSLGDYILKTEAQSNYETISGAQGKYQAKLTAGTGIEITGENVINVTLDTNIYQVVESLPESGINPNKIYLVLSAESGETNLYTEYLYVNSEWEKIGEYKADVDLTPYLKSSDAASTYATKQELAGEASEREKQDSALGGMIAGETEAREQAITNLTATVHEKLDTSTYNSEKASFETKEHAAATYQPKGDYITSIPDNYVTDEELNGKGYATTTQLSAKLDVEAYNNDKATFALKSEIPDTSTLATKTELTEGLAVKANTSDLSNYLTTTDAQSTYSTKSELVAKLDVETYNSEKATFALKSELPDTSDLVTKATADETYQPKGEYLTAVPDNYVTDEELNGKGYATTAQLNGKQDTLVSGTNIKTINGNSLLGEGDITIEGGSSITIDTELSETSVNPVQNKVINTALNNKVDLTVYNAKIAELEAMIGQISTKLDEINGETI